MENRDVQSYAVDVADRIWRSYLPFRRGRSTAGDLTAMLTILALARFVQTRGEPESELSRRWARAVTEARSGASPLVDLHAAMQNADMADSFPISSLTPSLARPRGVALDDMPWVAAFLTELEKSPPMTSLETAEICDLLLDRHAQESPSSAGEFYTPRGIVDLIVRLTSPQPGDRILDPACGTGGMLAAAAQYIAEAGRVDRASFEAYAMTYSNMQLAKMNMILHGIARPAVQAADPLSLYQSGGSGLVDRVLSNPPFNQRIDRVEDVNWPFGIPPKTNANFVWLQLAWSRLSDDGIAGIIMPAGAAFHDGRAASIRRKMVINGALLGIVSLPTNLFYETSIPVHIWLLARDKTRPLSKGVENTVLFVDATGLGTQEPRQPRTLSTADIKRISGRFSEWLRSSGTTVDEPGFSRAVTHEEILANGSNLDPRRYVNAPQKEQNPAPDLRRLLESLDRSSIDSSAELREAFDTYEQLIRTGNRVRHVPLQSIISSSAQVLPEGNRPGRIIAGPSGSLIRADDYEDDGIPVVMPKDLTDTGFSTKNIRYIAAEKARSLERFHLHRGDIVLARRGELGRCAVVRNEQQGWVCGTGCFVLRPPSAVDADYLAAYFRSTEAREWLNTHSTGSMAMKTISLDVLANLPIAIPDLGVQRAIAAIMTRLDDHKRMLQEQLELTQGLRRDALQEFLKS
ncbi:N-6 DNA methylase [Spirillospora sp. CA-253888]